MFKTLIGGAVVLFLSLTAVASVAFAASVTVFSTNFDAGAPLEFSGVTTTEGVQSYAGLGTGLNVFGGDFLRNTSGNNFGGGPAPLKTTLTLTGLPAHTSISLGFLLAIIDSWDGDGCFAGPDRFNVTVDGVVLFSGVFENSGCGTQTYVPPTGVELARKLQLGFNPGNLNHLDSAYNMGLDPIFQNIPHTSSTLTIEWFASGFGWQGGTDESYAIDNVEVILNFAAQGLKESAISDLQTLLASLTGPTPPGGVGNIPDAVANLNEAIAFLQASLASFQPTDPNRLVVDPMLVDGTTFFDNEENAVEEIFDAIDSGMITNPALLAQLQSIVVDKILAADEIVAQTAIDDAVAAGGNPDDLADAQAEFATAQDQITSCVTVGIAALMFCDDAVGSFEDAWQNAQKAVGALP